MPALAHSTAYRGLSSMSTVAPISLQEVRHPSVPGQLSVRPCFSITYSDFTHSALSAAVLGHLQGNLPHNKCSESLQYAQEGALSFFLFPCISRFRQSADPTAALRLCPMHIAA